MNPPPSIPEEDLKKMPADVREQVTQALNTPPLSASAGNKQAVLTTGSLVIYMPILVAPSLAIVTPKPGILIGTGKSGNKKHRIAGLTVCIQGDHEKSGYAEMCSYISPPPFINPGKGTLRIGTLKPDNLSGMGSIVNTLVMVVGTIVPAWFEVMIPATTPNGVPDPKPFYQQGTCMFKPAQKFLKNHGTFDLNAKPKVPFNVRPPEGMIGAFPSLPIQIPGDEMGSVPPDLKAQMI